jgi:hypothetical protein
VHLSGWKASNQSFNVNKDRKLNISNTEPHKIDNKAVNMVLKHTFSYWAFKRSTIDINSKSSSWSWSYGSWIYKFLCNQCLLHTTKVVSSNPVHGEVYSIQHYVIKLVSNLWQGRWFSPCIPVSSTNKTDRHDIHVTEILLKVAFKTINSSVLLWNRGRSRQIELVYSGRPIATAAPRVASSMSNIQ